MKWTTTYETKLFVIDDKPWCDVMGKPEETIEHMAYYKELGKPNLEFSHDTNLKSAFLVEEVS